MHDCALGRQEDGPSAPRVEHRYPLCEIDFEKGSWKFAIYKKNRENTKQINSKEAESERL